MKRVRFWVPKILIVVGLCGMLCAAYVRYQLMKAIIVMKWCEVDNIKADLPMDSDDAATPACTALRDSEKVSGKKGRYYIPVLVSFYNKHSDYLKEDSK